MSNKVYPVLIIPAYNPDRKLVELIVAHSELNIEQQCIVVNDGSSTESESIFRELEQLDCVVLHHPKNMGKGAALKTAMNYYLDHLTQGSCGVITADADGQHLLTDIIRLSMAFTQEPSSLHLGCREISKNDVPLRSRIGNTVTRYLFNLFTHNNLRDTQTGLRAIPIDLVRLLVTRKTERYEFEFEMFFVAKKYSFKIRQMPIETVYIDDNKGSHFNPLFDSLRIYFIFIRFCSISLISFIIDFTVFSLMLKVSGVAGFAVGVARMISAPFNFLMNKKVVFKADSTLFYSILFYGALATIIAFSSFKLMVFIHYLGVNIYLSKIVAEALIFLTNFVIQYYIVFDRRSSLAEAN